MGVWLKPDRQTLGWRNAGYHAHDDENIVCLKKPWKGKLTGTVLDSVESKPWVPLGNDYFLPNLQKGIDYIGGLPKETLPNGLEVIKVFQELQRLQEELVPNSRSSSVLSVARRRLVD